MNLTILPNNNTYKNFALPSNKVYANSNVSGANSDVNIENTKKRKFNVKKAIIPTALAMVGLIILYCKSGLKTKVDDRLKIVNNFIKNNFYNY